MAEHRPLRISAVARVPASSGPPALSELDGFVAPSNVTLAQVLNEPEQFTFSVFPASQPPEILTRFLDLAANPTEIWAFCPDCGEQMFAGPVLGYNPGLAGDEKIWTIHARGVLDYLRRWRIEPDGADLVFTATDQADIAAGLIDYYQALTFGHYGIDTSAVASTGVSRDRSYLAIEAHLIAQRLSELAAVADGFDFSINTDRELVVDFPFQGVDRTADIVIDARSVADPAAQISVGPEDLASEGFAIGDDDLVSHASNTTLRAAYGRTSFASGFSGVNDPTTLADHAQRLIDQRSTHLHVPARVLYPVGFDWDQFDLGDTVEFAYDYGAGPMIEARRIFGRTMVVDGGVTKIQVAI